MDFYINLKVNFRGNSKNFLLSGSETKNWESMEAMVKRSFGLCSLQLTYFDEENEEVSINSQVEYEEALKSAARQGNRLHMNLYEIRGQPARVPTTKASGTEPKRGFRPPQHCPTLAQVVSRKVQAVVPEQAMVIMKEVRGTKEEDKTPPAWFTSYMEKFKDQVVREAVEKICREFSGQCCIHKPVGGGGGGGAGGAGRGRGEAVGGAEPQQVPEVSSSTLPGSPSSSTPPCSSCRGQTTGGGYQCSVCTSCTLCEPCSFSHDPSHNLVRARTPLSIPEHGSPAPDHSRFYRRGDRSFRKAEKQRLKAEKRLLKAEVKEIRKQLRMERRGIQWSSSYRDGSSSPILLQPRATQHNSPERPKRPCPLVVPAMMATFLDENLPDGTRLRPGTKFIKYWKMRNTGTISWGADTKLRFMWGNLAVGSGDRWKEVSVPFLQPGQIGIVSVALCAPVVEGSYTSHWRLAHAGEQFGPRVWCSIMVDPLAPAPMMADGILVSPCVTPQGKNPDVKDLKASTASGEPPLMSVDQEEYYIPSVDLLTAQDLLSFELLDINIVQELESVPTNTPTDITPCMSPLPQDGHLQDKSSPSLSLIQEKNEVINSIMAWIIGDSYAWRRAEIARDHKKPASELILTTPTGSAGVVLNGGDFSCFSSSPYEEKAVLGVPFIHCSMIDLGDVSSISEEGPTSLPPAARLERQNWQGSQVNIPDTAGSGAEGDGVPAQEEGGNVCETVICSMTLEESPDHAQEGLHIGKVVHPAAQSGSSSMSCMKTKTVKTKEISDSSPSSPSNPLKPPLTLKDSKDSLHSPLQASLPAAPSVDPAAVPGPSSVPTLLQVSARASTQQQHTVTESQLENFCLENRVKVRNKEPDKEKDKDGEEKREGTRSRSSSTSSEDYIIILPDCFDTSRPLGESMYSSALSQPGDIPVKTLTDPDTMSSEHTRRTTVEKELHKAGEDAVVPGTELSGNSSANDMLCTSQTLDDEPLTPEVVAPSKAIITSSPASSGKTDVDVAISGEGAKASVMYQTENASGPKKTQTGVSAATADTEEEVSEDPRHPGITSGLVKGALSVAASAYKALFTGQGPTQPTVDASTKDTMMAVLVEMGFGDQPLNQQLLKKHNYNLLDVVNELVQMTNNDWYSTRY